MPRLDPNLGTTIVAMTIPFPGRMLPPTPGAFRALRHRNFRLLWIGQVISLTGGWMQSVAQGWLVLRLTDSAFYLGLVGFFSFLPVLLFALPAGVAADHLPRRKTLFWTQAGAMLLSLTLAALTYFEVVRVWHIVSLAFVMGTLAALAIPVRQSLLQDLVGREDLPNAIALNSLSFNGARLVGPLLAAPLLPLLGEAPLFLINSISFLAVLIAINRMQVPRSEPATRQSWTAEIRAGINFATGEPRVRSILALVVVTSVCGSSYSVILPVFARDILGVGAGGLGTMMGATGVGATAGALLLASQASRLRTGRTIAVAMATLGLGLVGFAAAPTFPVALALLFVVGMSMLIQMAVSNTALQMLAPPDMRGRIISLYMLAFLGTAPVGALTVGALAQSVGAPATVAGGGVICVLTAAWFVTRIPALRAASAEQSGA